MFARLPKREPQLPKPPQRRRSRITDGQVTLPLGIMGVVLTVLSRADVITLLPAVVQDYVLGAAALATTLGAVDLWEHKKDQKREQQKLYGAEPEPNGDDL